MKIGSLTDELPGLDTFILLNIEGDEKTGKNHLAFQAPAPIAYFNISDRSNSKLLRRCAKRGVKVYHSFYKLPESDNLLRVRDPKKIKEHQAIAREEWLRLRADYTAFLKSPETRSGVIDTGGKLKSLIELYRFGKLLEIPPMLRSWANNDFMYLFVLARKYKKNLILLHRLADEWKRGKGESHDAPTGKRVLQGHKQVPFEVDANVRTWRKDGHDGPVFGATVMNSGDVGESAGAELEGEELSFAKVAALVKGTKEAAWR
jgi:hypothetical protein